MENLKRNKNLHRSQWQFSIFENSSTLNEKILLDLVTSALNATKEKKGNQNLGDQNSIKGPHAHMVGAPETEERKRSRKIL